MPTYEDKRTSSLKGTSAEWIANDITPIDGELCIEDFGSGVMKIKIGNGVDPYSGLAYVAGYTLSELHTVIDERLATFGITASTGAPDAGKLVRLDGSGTLDSSFFPDSILDGAVRFLGWLNARDDDVDTALGPGFTFQSNDLFIMTRDGTYDASWPTIGGTAGFDNDLCWYKGASFGFEINPGINRVDDMITTALAP